MGGPHGVSWPAGMIKGMTLVKINYRPSRGPHVYR